MNMVILRGTLSEDPYVIKLTKTTKIGKEIETEYVRLRLKLSRLIKSEDSGYKVRYDTVTAYAYNKMAELCTRYLKKKDTVSIRGHINVSGKPTDSNNVVMSIIVNEIFLDLNEDGIENHIRFSENVARPELVVETISKSEEMVESVDSEEIEPELSPSPAKDEADQTEMEVSKDH